MFKRERSGGNYGGGTKELQMINYRTKQEREAKRKVLFNTGLEKFNKGEIQPVTAVLQPQRLEHLKCRKRNAENGFCSETFHRTWRSASCLPAS